MRRILSMILAGCLLGQCAIGCAAGSIDEWAEKWDAAVSDSTVIALSPGRDDTEMQFNWLSAVGEKNVFLLAADSDMADSKTYPVSERLTVTGQKVCRVTVTDLTPDTTYYYCYTKNGIPSDVYSFRTAGDTLTALFVTDAQLGRSDDRKSKDVLLHDVAGWDTTLEQSRALHPDISLILSAGDQAEVGACEQEYRLLLAPDSLRSVPIAPVVGNHEFYFPYLYLHFALPNRVGGSIVHSLGDEPYYFMRGKVLFIQLESNDPLAPDHEAVIDRALRQYPDARWRVVTMHHSLYSCENSEEKGPALRKALTPLLQKYGVDLVLSGHTHRYSRTYPLWDGAKADNGIVYMEGGCASACNSKPCREDTPDYTAAGYRQAGNAVYSVLTFSDDSVHITSYAVENGKSVPIDSADVLKNTRSDPNARMPLLRRAWQAVLSVCGRCIALFYV